MSTVKQPLNYAQQIDRLRNFHGLVIEDEEECKDILNRINYYRLSGYGIGLTEKANKDKYLPGVSLKQLYDLYCFDSLFKNYLFFIIEQIEVQLRSQISYELAINYGSLGYKDPSYFQLKYNKKGQLIHTHIIDSLNDEIKRQQNIPFVKHHITKYKGDFPIWVAVELLSFGNLSSLYSIMLSQNRKNIANLYMVRDKYLDGWIQSLVEVRNICAHYGRLYNLPLKHTPFLYKENRPYKGNKNKIFPVLLVIKRLLKANEQWGDFYKKIEETLDKHSQIVNLSFMGFPDDWKVVLQKKLTNVKPKGINNCCSVSA